MNGSVRPTVRPSVRPSVRLLHIFHYVPIIVLLYMIKFSEVITKDNSDVNAKGQVQRSKVKVTKVKTQFSRVRAITQFEYTYGDEMKYKARCCLGEVAFKVIRQISR